MSFFVSHKRGGFSIAEVIVAVSIIALLASVVIVNVQDGRKKARDAQRVSDLQQLQLAIRAYRDANSSDYPASLSGELVARGSGMGALTVSYLTKALTDPLTGTSGYGYYYDTSYTCNGSHVVLIARTMERTGSGNFASKCGSGPYEATAGITPTASSYILILK